MKSVESEKLRKLFAVDKPTTVAEHHAHDMLFNLAEARENGYDAACVECGTAIGMLDDEDEQMHEDWCELEQRNAVAEAEFADRVKRILVKESPGITTGLGTEGS